ncbi:luciferin 4-monooxygenase-like isoform X2 [Cylas formicarius]|nr:luciferin 4-monooxygenase-like isoform X2 [Cylas formicarius]
MFLKFKAGSSKTTPPRGSFDLRGSKLGLPLSYGGLGNKYYDQLVMEPDKILQVDLVNNITETRGSVRSRSIQVAVEMRDRGVRLNDIILISSRSHAHQTIVVLATLFLGAIVAPLNPDSPYRECLELVRKLKPRMCFCDSRTVSQIERILATLNIVCDVVNFGNDHAGTIQFCKLFPYREPDWFKPVFIDRPENEVAFILPTQGTCAEPKLTCLSHHNVYTQTCLFMEIFDRPSKVISFFPLSWIVQTVLCCASFDYGVLRILPGSFNERSACKLIQDFVVDTAILGTDLTLKLIENVAIRDYNLDCLKCALVGVVSTTRSDLHHMRRLLPDVKLLQVYFTTETGFITAVSSANYAAALSKPGSVGRILHNGKIKILALKSRERVGPHEYGELYFSGDGVMLGYFKDNSATLTTMEKGYFKSGDVAQYDDDGWLYLRGRVDDIIHVSADNFYFPVAIEDVILSHPTVCDAAVIGNAAELIACVQKKSESTLTADKLMS